jgi:hypothetical protein
MGETYTHKYFVRLLIAHVENSIKDKPEEFFVYADGETLSGGTPRAIGSSIPDVFAISESREIVFIGEAKSATDIERDHTNRQLVDYVKYLKNIKYGELVFAVPWYMIGAIDSMIRKTLRDADAADLPYTIIRYLSDEEL